MTHRATPLLLHVGIATIVVGLAAIHAGAIGDYDLTGSSRVAWTLLYVVVSGVAAYAVGFPDLVRGPRVGTWAFAASGSAALVFSILQLAAGSLLLPRFVVFGAVVITPPWLVGCAHLSRGARRRTASEWRVLAVLDAQETLEMKEDLAGGALRPATLVRAISVDDAVEGNAIVSAVDESGANVVVLDRRAQEQATIVSQAATVHERGVRVRTLALFYEEWLGKLPISELERISLLFDIGELHRPHYGRVKRLVDVVVALVGFLPLLVVLGVTLVANPIANRGPLFYRQVRVGRGGGTIDLLKLRTLRPTSGPTVWTQSDDERVTLVGRWLRRTHLDELPQVINILKGDLSVVGPRPEQPQYVEALRAAIPFYDVRHLVRPGLTGWAQLNYPYGASESDALEKLQYEFYYLRHQSFALDAKIILRTLRAVAMASGR